MPINLNFLLKRLPLKKWLLFILFGTFVTEVAISLGIFKFYNSHKKNSFKPIEQFQVKKPILTSPKNIKSHLDRNNSS